MRDYTKLFSLKDEVAVVVGGAGGIGREIVSALSQFGAKVVIVSKTNKKLKYFYDEYRSIARDISFFECDITDENAVIDIFENIKKTYGTIDILINAAAINILDEITDCSLEDWNRIMDINLKGTFLCSREVAKIMKAKKKGKIINFASLAAVSGHKRHGAYAASKAGVVMFTKVLANELAEFNVNVNAIGPACIVTDVNRTFFEDKDNFTEIVDEIPLKRLGTPEDIVGGVIYLASKASNFVSGILLLVDGAASAV